MQVESAMAKGRRVVAAHIYKGLRVLSMSVLYETYLKAMIVL